MVQKQNEQLLNDEIITTFLFLNHDNTEEDEFKVFLFIFFIFFSVIMVQKQNEQLGTHIIIELNN